MVGFYFLDLAKTYIPPPDLEEFLNAGDPPIYIGSVDYLISMLGADLDSLCLDSGPSS